VSGNRKNEFTQILIPPVRVLAAIIILLHRRQWSLKPRKIFSEGANPDHEKAREVALLYTANLPNFITTETIRRSTRPRRSQTWKSEDTLTNRTDRVSKRAAIDELHTPPYLTRHYDRSVTTGEVGDVR
jgi:hypothetical protein